MKKYIISVLIAFMLIGNCGSATVAKAENENPAETDTQINNENTDGDDTFSNGTNEDDTLSYEEINEVTNTASNGTDDNVLVTEAEKENLQTAGTPDYLKFTAQQANATVTLKQKGTPDSISLETSTDGNTWTTYTVGNAITLAKIGDYVYFRSTSDNTAFSKDDSNYYCFSMSNKIAASGNVMSLLDSTCESKILSSGYIFYRLFSACTNLTTAPELPAETLSACCYLDMFYNCLGLTAAPVLPAETLAKCCYQSMFYGCTNLISAPVLPAETLADSCYRSMFSGCKSLTTAPELPAETLCVSCYENMFYECESLATVPTLPAETLADRCYDSMFSRCKSLTSAPELPAETLYDDCYYGMFADCTNLETAPNLPATTLATWCYGNMFKNCTSLTSVQQSLPATTLVFHCYTGMFSGCTSLTTIPELPATTLADLCYNIMFYGCTNLKVHEKVAGENKYNNKYAITMPSTFLSSSVADMFSGTGGSFTGTPEAGKTYVLDASLLLTADSGNTNPTYGTVGDLKYTINAVNFKTNPTTESISLTCYSDSALKNKMDNAPFNYSVSGSTLTISSKTTTQPGDYYIVVSDDVKAEPVKITVDDYDYLKFTAQEANATVTLNRKGSPYSVSLQTSTDGNTWSNYTIGKTITLTNIGDYVYFKATSNNTVFSKDGANYYYFSMSSKIAASGNIMSLLDSTCKSKIISKDYAFCLLFDNCTALTSAPELPAETLANNCYDCMFDDCTSLTTAPELPAETLAKACYDYMFSGCTSLVNAPELPAETLAESCYRFMFNDCTSLTVAPSLPVTTLENYCYNGMFSGCTSLTTAPSLPAETLKTSCYNHMFYGCKSLTTAPVLPATTLADYCYSSMFSGCTSLTTAPVLPATVLVRTSYYYMFYGCTNLTKIPELNIVSLGNSSCVCMFRNCTKVNLHEKGENENVDNKITIVIPSGLDGLTNPVTDMFTGTGGSFTGTPEAGKTYVLDASLSLTANKNNVNPTYGTAGSLKYTINAVNFKTNPTTESISLICYSDSALKNKITDLPFTYSVSGSTLTISSKTTTEAGDYYVVVSDDVKADPVKITVTSADSIEPDTSWYSNIGGTADNPYLLHNTAQLEGLAKLVNSTVTFNGKYIKLADDFDNTYALTTVIGNANAYVFEGVSGIKYYQFQGHFDGNSKEVKLNLTYDSTSNYYYFGMFGLTEGADISNLTVSGNFTVNTTSRIYCGGLVGYAYKTDITDCCSKVNINAKTTKNHAYCGGLVGNFIGDSDTGGIILNSYTTGNVTSETTTKTAMAGGIAGSVTTKGSVLNCYSRGNMTAVTASGIAYAAGIAGMNQDLIRSCYSTGTMTASQNGGTAYAAGLAGSNTGTVEKSYCSLETFVGTGSGTLKTSYKIDTASRNLYKNNSGTFTDTGVTLLDQLIANADKYDYVSWRIIEDKNDGYPVYRYPKYAASIGDTKYRTVQKAIDACSENASASTTVKLLGNADERLSITNGRNIVLDLNSYELTAHGENAVVNCWSVIYVDESAVLIKNGSLKNIDDGYNGYDINCSYHGTAVIEDCQLEGSFITYYDGEIKVSGNTVLSVWVENRFVDDSMRITANTDSKTKSDYPYALKAVTTDTSWYDSSLTIYTLKDTADLEGFAKLVNNGNSFEGKTVKLAKDFSDTTPLTTIIADYGTVIDGYAEFKGSFDGNGRTVKIDIDVDSALSTVFAGMFGEVNNGSISNLTVNGTVIVEVKKKAYVGGLAGYLKKSSVIDNCAVNVAVKSDVNGDYHSYAGGIAGQVADTGIIKNCSSRGSLNSFVSGASKTAMAAGIAAAVSEKATIINCYSTGSMIVEATGGGTANAAGIVSINEGTVKNCYSISAVSATGTGKYAGGIAGQNRSTGNISYCYSPLSTLIKDNKGTSEKCYRIVGNIEVGETGKESSLNGCLNNYLIYYEKGNGYTRWKTTSKNRGYPVLENVNVAKIDKTSFLSLKEAIDYIDSNNLTAQTTITLLENTEECITVSSGRNIVLDLNSKELAGSNVFDTDNRQAAVYVDGGKLTVKNGTVKGINGTAINNNDGTVILESGYYSGSVTTSNSSLTINGGYYSELPDEKYLGKKRICLLNTDKETRNYYAYKVMESVTADISWYSTNGGKSAKAPYLLHDTADLEGLANLVNGYGYDFAGKYVKLADDFDGSVALQTVIGNGTWLTMSEDNKVNTKFKGHFDGNSKEVKLNLSYTYYTVALASGMFGLVEDGEIKNLTVSGDIAILTPRKVYCGGIVAVCSNSVINNCCSKVNIDVETTDSNNYCGGLVGNLKDGGKIIDSYSNGSIKAVSASGKALAGGVCAIIEVSGDIKNSFSRGDVTALSDSNKSYAGGIVGDNQGYVLGCYSTGAISAASTSSTAYCGGLAAKNEESSTVRKSYAVFNSPLIGDNSGDDLNNYKIVDKDVVGKSTVALIDQLNDNATKFSLSEWSIEDGVNDGYPVQKSIEYVASITSENGVAKKYTTLSAALYEAKADQTIVMINDSDESVTSFIVNKNVTLDLNGTDLSVKSMNVVESDKDNCHPLIIDTAADDAKGSLSYVSGFVYTKSLAKTESTDTTVRYIPVCIGENTYQFNEVLVGTANKTTSSLYWKEGDQAFVGAYLRSDLDVPTILKENSGVSMGLKIKIGDTDRELTFESTTTSEYITKYTHAKPYFHIKGIEDEDSITVNGYVTQNNSKGITYRFDGISRSIALVK